MLFILVLKMGETVHVSRGLMIRVRDEGNDGARGWATSLIVLFVRPSIPQRKIPSMKTSLRKRTDRQPDKKQQCFGDCLYWIPRRGPLSRELGDERNGLSGQIDNTMTANFARSLSYIVRTFATQPRSLHRARITGTIYESADILNRT